MKVAMLGYWPREGEPYGGTTMHVVKLTQALQYQKDVKLFIFAFGDHDHIQKVGQADVRIIGRRTIYKLFPFLALLKLTKMVNSVDPDIIHLHGTNLSPYLLYTMFLRKRRSEVLMTIHGVMDIELRLKSKISLFDRLSIFAEHLSLRFHWNVILCSRAMHKLVPNISKNRVRVIPNGVNLEEIDATLGRVEVDGPSIAFVGTLRRVKGLDTLLRAAAILQDRCPFHLYVAGTGEEEGGLKELVSELGLQNIHFLGFISEEKKFELLHSVDLCVFPSRYEPFGIVVLEAMACGRPVIASKIGGIPEIVQDGKTGILCTPEDPSDLAQKIELVLQDKELRYRLGAAAKEAVKEYTWSKVAEETAEYYRDINGQ